MQRLDDAPRALRYPMAAPVIYRAAGQREWISGRTLNISRSGVLIEASGPVLPPATRLEFVLMLPSLGIPGRARVQCAGRVVRFRDSPGGLAMMAATIDVYDFLGPVPGMVADVTVM
jgi:hypothetical protein